MSVCVIWLLGKIVTISLAIKKRHCGVKVRNEK